MERRDKVAYVGEEWGSWRVGKVGTVAGFKRDRDGKRLVEVYSPPTDNQYFYEEDLELWTA